MLLRSASRQISLSPHPEYDKQTLAIAFDEEQYLLLIPAKRIKKLCYADDSLVINFDDEVARLQVRHRHDAALLDGLAAVIVSASMLPIIT